jgi:hypothetical protein
MHPRNFFKIITDGGEKLPHMTLDIIGYYSMRFADHVTVCLQCGDRGCMFTRDLLALLIIRERAGIDECDGEYCRA